MLHEIGFTMKGVKDMLLIIVVHILINYFLIYNVSSAAMQLIHRKVAYNKVPKIIPTSINHQQRERTSG